MELTCGTSPLHNSSTVIPSLHHLHQFLIQLPFPPLHSTQMNFTVAVDFTQSNGVPNQPNSLHHYTQSKHSPYAYALQAVGDIIKDYDSLADILSSYLLDTISLIVILFYIQLILNIIKLYNSFLISYYRYKLGIIAMNYTLHDLLTLYLLHCYSDKMFPALGFGGKLANGQVSHDFFLVCLQHPYLSDLSSCSIENSVIKFSNV